MRFKELIDGLDEKGIYYADQTVTICTLVKQRI